MDFHEKIYQRFQQIAAMDQDRVVKVACEDLTIEEIHQKVIDSVF
jgi:thymidylate kinase